MEDKRFSFSSRHGLCHFVCISRLLYKYSWPFHCINLYSNQKNHEKNRRKEVHQKRWIKKPRHWRSSHQWKWIQNILNKKKIGIRWSLITVNRSSLMKGKRNHINFSVSCINSNFLLSTVRLSRCHYFNR